jgi:hypothetical protein
MEQLLNVYRSLSGREKAHESLAAAAIPRSA